MILCSSTYKPDYDIYTHITIFELLSFSLFSLLLPSSALIPSLQARSLLETRLVFDCSHLLYFPTCTATTAALSIVYVLNPLHNSSFVSFCVTAVRCLLGERLIKTACVVRHVCLPYVLDLTVAFFLAGREYDIRYHDRFRHDHDSPQAPGI